MKMKFEASELMTYLEIEEQRAEALVKALNEMHVRALWVSNKYFTTLNGRTLNQTSYDEVTSLYAEIKVLQLKSEYLNNLERALKNILYINSEYARLSKENADLNALVETAKLYADNNVVEIPAAKVVDGTVSENTETTIEQQGDTEENNLAEVASSLNSIVERIVIDADNNEIQVTTQPGNPNIQETEVDITGQTSKINPRSNPFKTAMTSLGASIANGFTSFKNSLYNEMWSTPTRKAITSALLLALVVIAVLAAIYFSGGLAIPLIGIIAIKTAPAWALSLSAGVGVGAATGLWGVYMWPKEEVTSASGAGVRNRDENARSTDNEASVSSELSTRSILGAMPEGKNRNGDKMLASKDNVGGIGVEDSSVNIVPMDNTSSQTSSNEMKK